MKNALVNIFKNMQENMYCLISVYTKRNIKQHALKSVLNQGKF